ncbi:MAG: DNA topoisomerase IV subunit A, partial [Pseudomonadota bacterium]
LDELPELARGKGNKIIGIPSKKFAAREEFVTAICVASLEANLLVVSGQRTMTLRPRDLEAYSGARGRRGALLPRGWRRVESLQLEES